MIGPSDHLRVCATPIVKCETARAHLFSSCNDRRSTGGDQKADSLRWRLISDEYGRATFVAHQSCASQPVDRLSGWHRLGGRQLKAEWGFPCKPSRDYLRGARPALELQDPVQVTLVNLGSSLYVVRGAYPLDGIRNKDQT